MSCLPSSRPSYHYIKQLPPLSEPVIPLQNRPSSVCSRVSNLSLLESLFVREYLFLKNALSWRDLIDSCRLKENYSASLF
ncbi:hypothetical protein L596_014087 [Steinernema carpocapsae]|uniref:Uncharacterized protein n=1 Tax=Steinernema carpocapsae TaxID=34508 RepID=A0A4U5NC08_STECR|nr:hypothetical protein L596_014087 [Steinernema carpocapsae]